MKTEIFLETEAKAEAQAETDVKLETCASFLRFVAHNEVMSLLSNGLITAEEAIGAMRTACRAAFIIERAARARPKKARAIDVSAAVSAAVSA